MDDVDHALLKHAKAMWGQSNVPKLERIKSIDDNILFKCKPNVPFRAAVWLENAAHDKAWLVAAGPRSSGSREDFYEALKSYCERKLTHTRKSLSGFKPGKKTHSDHLIPTDDDRMRLQLEQDYAVVLQADQKITDMVRKAQQNPTTVFSTKVYGCDVEALVEVGDYQELFVHIMIVGSAPQNAMNLILTAAVPDVVEEDWDFLEEPPAGMGTSGGMYCYTLLAPGWHGL